MNSLCRSISQIASTRKHQILSAPIFIQQSYSMAFSAKSTAKTPKPQAAPASPPPPPPPSVTEKVAVRDWPRPSEIPFQSKVANSVHLIGYVQMPVQFQAASDGKFWAGTVITQNQSDDSSPVWIPIIFEGDLAHIAVCHLKENDHVYIEGSLSADPPPLSVNQGQANLQVMAQNINFVKGSFQRKISSAPHKLAEWTLSRPASVNDDKNINEPWKHLIAFPHDWWDIRSKEGNPKGAAFERKDNGELLWFDNSTPKWIHHKLESMTFDSKTVVKSLKSTNFVSATVKEDKVWREILDNPNEWLDFRDQKCSGQVKPKHPDFKRKDGSLALWLNSAPGWFLSELEGTNVDVKIYKLKQVKELKGEKSWKDLVDNPDKWWDNRANKLNVRSPDFKHKDTGEALWLSNSPTWVLPKLPPVKCKEDDTFHRRDTLLS